MGRDVRGEGDQSVQVASHHVHFLKFSKAKPSTANQLFSGTSEAWLVMCAGVME